jgi:hypothetical protein
MLGYASNTGTRRNLAALRDAGWRLKPEPFAALVEHLGCAADFVILPDIVAGGEASLDLSVSWIPRLRGIRKLLLPLQDGMTAHDGGSAMVGIVGIVGAQWWECNGGNAMVGMVGAQWWE